MRSNILRSRNGAELTEVQVPSSASSVIPDRQFVVTKAGSSVPLYKGPDRLAAERAFEQAIRPKFRR
jgi:hypothetical protein